MIILAARRVVELVFLKHDLSNDSHVSNGLGFFVFYWLPMIIPEELVGSEHRVSLVTDHTEGWHAARDPEGSVKTTVDRLW